MGYTKKRDGNEWVVEWDTTVLAECPTLSQVVEAARKEFPEVPFEKLVMDTSGFDGELIQLKWKS